MNGFLGALIIVYALYPLILKAHKKNSLFTLIILFALTVSVHAFNIPVISPGFPGICECCLKLYLGILIYEQFSNINKQVIIASIILILVYTFVKIEFINLVLDVIYSVCIYIVLFKIGTIIMKNKTINRTCTFIGSISYQVFLLQHMIINIILSYCNPINVALSFVTLIICILTIMVLAFAINKVISAIMKSNFINNIENKLVK